MKQKALVLVVTLLALLFASSMTARPAFACTCGGEPAEVEAFANADVVFIGKVAHVTREWVGEYKLPNHTYQLNVQSATKGQVGSSVTFRLKSSCSYGFAQGATYLVYANYSPNGSGELDASICSGTKLISKPGFELLGRSVPPWAQLLLGAVGSIFILTLVVLTLVYVRERRNKATTPD